MIKNHFFKHVFFAGAVLWLSAAQAQEPGNFAHWLEGLKAEARSSGISEQALAALNDISPDDSIVELDRKQPEGTVTFAQYQQRVLSQKRITDGRELFERYRTELGKATARFGVEPEFIVALWGVETSYGANTGDFYVVEALATLAYEGRRAAFFRKELLAALRILDEEHITSDAMLGSWAGAMGQCQFMPSSFLKFSADGNGDGHRDIWNDTDDVFASIANYLATEGWKRGEGWGVPARIAQPLAPQTYDINVERTLEEWKKIGVTPAGAENLPSYKLASLARIGEEENAPVYLVFGNYKILLKWNRSRYFATSVGMLADSIASGQ